MAVYFASIIMEVINEDFFTPGDTFVPMLTAGAAGHPALSHCMAAALAVPAAGDCSGYFLGDCL